MISNLSDQLLYVYDKMFVIDRSYAIFWCGVRALYRLACLQDLYYTGRLRGTAASVTDRNTVGVLLLRERASYRRPTMPW